MLWDNTPTIGCPQLLVVLGNLSTHELTRVVNVRAVPDAATQTSLRVPVVPRK